MRSSKYDAALLAPIVQGSRTFADVLRQLGLPSTGGNYRLIATRVRQAELDTSHFRSATIAARCAAIPRETLELLAKECTSVAQVLDKLGMAMSGRTHRELTRRIRELAIDTEHFRGPGWSRGETRRTHPSIDRAARRSSLSDAELFVENSSLVNAGRVIIRRLLAMGWSYRCATCEITEWCGNRLVLHLDHINGIHNDNRLGNLRLLCPNCHSQTATYCRRSAR